MTAFLAPDALNEKRNRNRQELHLASIMAVANQTAAFAARTLEHVELEMLDPIIIIFLRKMVAILEENRYHI